jgi:hypothetical protein
MLLLVSLLLASSALAYDCPKDAFCGSEEKSCPLGLPDKDGCPAPAFCIPAKSKAGTIEL